MLFDISLIHKLIPEATLESRDLAWLLLFFFFFYFGQTADHIRVPFFPHEGFSFLKCWAAETTVTGLMNA